MPATKSTTLDLRAGDVVEVRTGAEILATLDENGELESLPFMPEMLRYCGQRLTVYKAAHKTCDTQTGSGMRRMENAVHLSGVRCDGSAHGGCQAACLTYWKHAWLRKVDPAEAPPVAPTPPEAALLPLLTIASRRPPADDGSEVYRCQATELLRAAPTVLPLKNVGQFVEDVRTGNAGVLWTLRTIFVASYNRMQGLSNRFLPPRLRIRGGRQWGFPRGTADRDADLAVPPAARRHCTDPLEGRGGEDPQRGVAESRHGVRWRDGPVLRTDHAGGTPDRLHHRRAHRPDDPDEEPMHRPRRRGLRGCVQPQLPARDHPVLAGDLAREDRPGRRAGPRRTAGGPGKPRPGGAPLVPL